MNEKRFVIPTILWFKTAWKTWRTRTHKKRFGVSLTNEEHDARKLYTILTEFIPFFDEKMEMIDYGPSREVS